MPPGGDGFYYFSTYFLVQSGEIGNFHVEFNRETVCTAYAEQEEMITDDIGTSCSGIAYANEGKKLNFSFCLNIRGQKLGGKQV